MLGFAPIAVTPLGAPSPNEAFTMQAQSGTYALSMQGAAKLITDIYPSGTYTVNGRAVGLSAGRPTQADSGTFLLEGQDVTFDYGYGIHVPSGTFTVTGQDAALDSGYGLVVGSQSFTLTGQDVSFAVTITMSAGSGSFTLTGQAITEDISEVVGSGSFTYSGQAVVMSAGRPMPVTVGTYTMTANDVKFRGYFTPFVAEETWTSSSVVEDVWTKVA